MRFIAILLIVVGSTIAVEIDAEKRSGTYSGPAWDKYWENWVKENSGKRGYYVHYPYMDHRNPFPGQPKPEKPNPIQINVDPKATNSPNSIYNCMYGKLPNGKCASNGKRLVTSNDYWQSVWNKQNGKRGYYVHYPYMDHRNPFAGQPKPEKPNPIQINVDPKATKNPKYII